jgi:CRISPR-associated protein Csm3
MVEIAITLTLRSPLNIGSGAQQGTLAKRGMLKDHEGWPFVPASALKGRWRHAVEQIAAALPNLRACATHHDMCRQQPCTVCQLFGSPWEPGRVRFANLPLTGPEAIAALRHDKAYYPKTTTRTGVAINRRRRVAQDDFLYDTELFLPGAPLEFSGVVQGDISRSQAAFLVAALRLVPALGRSKSAGMGWLDAAALVSDDGQPVSLDALAAAIKEGANV